MKKYVVTSNRIGDDSRIMREGAFSSLEAAEAYIEEVNEYADIEYHVAVEEAE